MRAFAQQLVAPLLRAGRSYNDAALKNPMAVGMVTTVSMEPCVLALCWPMCGCEGRVGALARAAAAPLTHAPSARCHYCCCRWPRPQLQT